MVGLLVTGIRMEGGEEQGKEKLGVRVFKPLKNFRPSAVPPKPSMNKG